MGSLEEFLPQTSWRGVRKIRTSMPGEAVSSLLKLLKLAAESVFEVRMGSRETPKCFPTVVLIRSNIPDAKDMFEV